MARALLIQAAATPLRILCAREFQNSIVESVHHLLKAQIEAIGLSSFYEVQNSVIRGANGSEFIFAGLRSNVTRIKSFEGCGQGLGGRSTDSEQDKLGYAYSDYS